MLSLNFQREKKRTGQGRGGQTTRYDYLAIFALIILLPPPSTCAQESQPTEPQSVSGADLEYSASQSTSTFEGGAATQVPAGGQAWGPAGGLGPDYSVGAGDVLVINVFNVKELSELTRRVGNDGTISLPLLDPVKVAGLSTPQIQKELQDVWGKTYLENPQVSVFVKEFRARPVSVIGAVARPGLYPLTARRSLIDVLSMAGGLGTKSTSSAPGRTVIVTRQGGFGDAPMVKGMRLISSDKLEIDLSRLLYSADDAANIQIQPLDVISVTKAPVIYVVGEVKKAGGFVLEERDKVTVLQALALAEGLYGNPAKGAARIIRTEPDGRRQQIRVDLGKVLKGKAPDPEMAANDILFVPTSTSKNVMKQATSNAVATVSGLIIWRGL